MTRNEAKTVERWSFWLAFSFVLAANCFDTLGWKGCAAFCRTESAAMYISYFTCQLAGLKRP